MKTPPWLVELLEEPQITDICMNGHEEVFYDQGKGVEPLPKPPWDEAEMRTWVLDLLAANNKNWDARNPFLDFTWNRQFRLHLAFPPLSHKGILVSIRRLQSKKESSLPQPRNWKSTPPFPMLAEIVSKGETLLISGSTGSGKTTLAMNLLECIPHSERIIALEDTPELFPDHPHFLSLLSRPASPEGFGEITLRSLLRQTLRMRPDRIVLGECRGNEVLDLLQILNTGHRGSVATLHANSNRDALRRCELLCLLAAGGTIPVSTIRDLIVSGVQWLVHVERREQERLVTEISHIEGKEDDTILLRPMLKSQEKCRNFVSISRSMAP